METAMGTQAWFIQQVQEHQGRLRASIRALGVRAEAVDDIAQDVFVLAWQKLAEFVPGDFGAWVVQIARRVVANERRKESRHSRILAGDVTDLLLRLNTDAQGLPDPLVRAEELGALQNCVEGLPPQGHQLIQWRYFDQLSPGAIASRLGRPSNYVRQCLLRLRRSLLQCVEKRLVPQEA
jgi:RNA polymerase sigma-70 factor (ECF subfamily)